MTRWRARLRGPHAERGAAAVEFAIVFVLLIFIIFSAIDFGRLFFTVQGMKSASREGARTAAVGGDYLTAVTEAGSSGASLSGGGTLQCKVFVSATGEFPDDPPGIDWAVVDGSSDDPGFVHECDAVADPCATVPLPNTVAAVRVRVSTPFTWFTPTMPLLGTVVGPANVPEVASQTTMRCE